MFIDVDDYENENNINQIEINDVVIAIKEMINKMKLKDFNELFLHFDEIENHICKMFSIHQFSDIGEGSFSTFCGKYMNFPFSQKRKNLDKHHNGEEQKIINFNEIEREVPLDQYTLSKYIEEIKQMEYLTNLYQNSFLKNIDIEELIETNHFEQFVFVEINKNNIIKLPVINELDIDINIDANKSNMNYLSAIIVSYSLKFSMEKTQQFIQKIIKIIQNSELSMKTQISRLQFVSLLLNQLELNIL